MDWIWGIKEREPSRMTYRFWAPEQLEVYNCHFLGWGHGEEQVLEDRRSGVQHGQFDLSTSHPVGFSSGQLEGWVWSLEEGSELEVGALQPWHWINYHWGGEVGKRRSARTRIWDTVIFRGRGGEKEPTKETKEEQLTRHQETQERAVFWELREKSVSIRGKIHCVRMAQRSNR